MKTDIPQVAIDFINGDSYRDALNELAVNRQEHIRKWVNGIAYRALCQDRQTVLSVFCPQMMEPMTYIVYRTIFSRLHLSKAEAAASDPLLAEIAKGSHVVEFSALPEWAQKKLIERQPLGFLKPMTAERQVKFKHILDYLDTLPVKTLSLSFAQAATDTGQWDKQLREQKVKANAFKGYQLQEAKCLKNTDWKLYQIVTQEALAYEGKKMHHCVGGYRLENHVIMSLMKGARHELTLDLVPQTAKRGAVLSLGLSFQVAQALGATNELPNREQADILKSLCAEFKWAYVRPKTRPARYDEEDREDDEDEDDDFNDSRCTHCQHDFECEYDDDDEDDDEEDPVPGLGPNQVACPNCKTVHTKAHVKAAFQAHYGNGNCDEWNW